MTQSAREQAIEVMVEGFGHPRQLYNKQPQSGMSPYPVGAAADPAWRILIMMGQTHVGVLQKLLAANSAYHVVPAATYLKTKAGRLLKAPKTSAVALPPPLKH